MSKKTSISKLAKWKRKEAKKKLSPKSLSKSRWTTTKQEGRYKRWRKSVCEMNKRKRGKSKHYICEKCGKQYKTTRYLHAHHIFSWKKFPDKRYTIKNGIVFCVPCHKGFHKTYGFDALDTPKLIVEYLGDSSKSVKDYVEKGG
jgi:hypothetical protein